MSDDGGSGKRDRTCPVGNHESAAGVSLRSRLPGVVAAKHLFDLPKRLRPLGFVLAFPVKGESLSADAATGLNLFLADSAKYLHVPDPLNSTPVECPSTRTI